MDFIEGCIVSLYVNGKNFIHATPKDVMFLGLFMGFLCTNAGWPKGRLRMPDILSEICGASTILTFLTAFCLIFYILIKISTMTMFYYGCYVIFGIVICKFIHLFLRFFGVLGYLLSTFLNIVSGPCAIFVAWFFYTNELLGKIKNLWP